MIERESLMAQLDAAKVFETHGQQIYARVYLYGQQKTADTLRALAVLIEESEFTYTAETFH